MEKQKLKAIVIGTTGAVGREVDSKDIDKAMVIDDVAFQKGEKKDKKAVPFSNNQMLDIF